MANLQFSMIPSLVILAALSSGAAAQCTNVVVSMSPCLNYGNSSAAPSAACCTQLNTVARSRPECLCQVIDSTTLGLSVDQTQAQALPKACNVHATNCKAASPSGSPGSTPNSGGGSSSPGNGSSDATSIRFGSLFAIFLVFTACIMF